MKEYVLQTSNLSKKYKDNLAVNNITMNIERGAIYGFIGKNGAGKTTFMRLISGLAAKTNGDIKLFNDTNLQKQRARIGCSIENPAVYPNLTARQNLEVQRKILGLQPQSVITDILELVGLNDDNKKVKKFSLGMKQRLEIGITLLGGPDFLILDEPINGLDPTGIKEVRELLLKLNKEKQITILISSHILGELYKIATCYGVINNGILVNEFTKDELEERCKNCIKIELNDIKKSSYILETVLDIKNYDIISNNTIRIFEKLDKVGAINTELTKNGVVINSITSIGKDLEGYFMELMEGGKGND